MPKLMINTLPGKKKKVFHEFAKVVIFKGNDDVGGIRGVDKKKIVIIIMDYPPLIHPI